MDLHRRNRIRTHLAVTGQVDNAQGAFLMLGVEDGVEGKYGYK